MPGIQIDHGTVTFSQSWLGSYLLCGERAKFAWLHPEASRSSDATELGTAHHMFCEQMIQGHSEERALGSAMSWLEQQIELQAFDWIKVKTEKTLLTYLIVLCDAWTDQVFPQLTPAPQHAVEHTFTVPLGHASDGTNLELKGTWDYLDAELGLMDWKTGSREYVEWEKKRWAIQPTAYTLAHHELFDENVPFTFVVNVKGPQPQPIQWVECHRGPEDWEWLRRLASRAYDNLKKDSWHLNDQHALCSRIWCDAWANGLCKGAISSGH